MIWVPTDLQWFYKNLHWGKVTLEACGAINLKILLEQI